MNTPEYLPNVKGHYEDYPYPERNPSDERLRLSNPMTDCLDRINHYCHSGRKDFSRDARILIAGGGTGDATIFYAEQVRDTNSEIIYLDFSSASMEIAQQRARIRGLNNITWINDSLLNIPSLDLGRFDHINCVGVLHHLADPEAGLRALCSVLKDDGAMSLMVYARYGRMVIYQVQELMRMVNHGVLNRQKQIDNCRKVLEIFPKKHWYHVSGIESTCLPDIELYDLFLHSQDRPYTIPELYELLRGAGLQMVRLFDPDETAGDALYDPAVYIKDPELLATVRELSQDQQQAVAEVMNGRIIKHNFYAAKRLVPRPDPSELDNIPSLSLVSTERSYLSLYQLVCASSAQVVIKVPNTGACLQFKKTPSMEQFFKYLNRKRSLKEIYDRIMMSAASKRQRRQGPLNYISLTEEFREMFAVTMAHSLLLLRHSSVPLYKTMEELHAQMRK